MRNPVMFNRHPNCSNNKHCFWPSSRFLSPWKDKCGSWLWAYWRRDKMYFEHSTSCCPTSSWNLLGKIHCKTTPNRLRWSSHTSRSFSQSAWHSIFKLSNKHRNILIVSFFVSKYRQRQLHTNLHISCRKYSRLLTYGRWSSWVR